MHPIHRRMLVVFVSKHPDLWVKCGVCVIGENANDARFEQSVEPIVLSGNVNLALLMVDTKNVGASLNGFEQLHSLGFEVAFQRL